MDNQNLAKELYSAISNSETNKVKKIIEENPSVIEMETPIGSWLHVAARYGNINIVKFLVESGLDINASGGTSGSTPINFSASEGHLELVQYFLDNDAFMDVSEPEKNPLFSAIHKGHLGIAKLLVEKGIDANVEYGFNNAISFAEEYDNAEMIDFLKGVLGKTKKVTTHDEVIAHLNSHFGKIKELSLKELTGDLMIHVIPSSPERDYIILATSGANIRNEQERYELLLYLPKSWNLSDLDDHWVVAWLRKVAYYDKIVSSENTFSNEETYQPLAPNTGLSGFIILTDQNDYGKIRLLNGTTVSFLDLLPLYKEEIELKRKAGTVELLERFQKHGITMVMDLARKNVGL